ncbi:MAG: hypothetical protein JWR83_2705 [Aeromicrobium sp.]|nr:hypothetical protein [Aeromicrobium sp.]
MNWLPALLALLSSLVSSPQLRWAGVLSGLDQARAAAFSAGDPALLDRVYARGSPGRDEDAATIRAYARRGGRITGAELTLLSWRLDDTSPRRVRLVVIDRLAAARVVWTDGTSRSLPRDLPTKHVITLVRTTDGWRIGD